VLTPSAAILLICFRVDSAARIASGGLAGIGLPTLGA
jgi:hypothetical protein